MAKAKKSLSDLLTEIHRQLSEKCKIAGFNLFFFVRDGAIIIQGTVEALNKNKNTSYNVKVSKLHSDLDDIWIYSEIKFSPIETTSVKEKDFYENNSFTIGGNPFMVSISISFYQGIQNQSKIQLFRAEWDNHPDNELHPQPHWQFYPNFIGSEINEIDIDNAKFVQEKRTFSNSNVSTNTEIRTSYNFNKFHFAMSSGNWVNSNSSINFIKNTDELSRWYVGLVAHVKEQILFSLKKK